jgi:hypothetical protein
MATVPIVSPAGDVGDIPFAQMGAALAAGGKPGVTIKSPDGKLGVVPADRYQDAVKAGGTVVPYQEQDTQHPGFWAHAADLMGGLLHPSGFSPYPGMDQEAKSAAATQATQQDQARKQAGYSTGYRALAPVAQSVGVNVPAMEQSAKEGDIAGVAAGAAVPAATLAAGEALSQGGRSIADAAESALQSRAGRAIGKTAIEAATDFPVIRKLAKFKENYDATAPEAHATNENKPFAGGMDEYIPPKKPVRSAPAPRTVVLDPESGKPEFSDIVAAKQNAPVQPQPKSVKAAAPPEVAVSAREEAPPATGTLESRLSALLEKAQNEPKVPEPEEDLTSLLQQSLDQVKARKGGVMTTANPADLAKRWGVDTESLQSGREQTRGMSPEQTEQYVNKLAESYKNGRPVEPVMETRDEANNVIDADGRARVLAAQRAGIERVPIMIRRIAKGPQAPTLEPELAGSTK